MKERKTPKEEGAPAYMAQYTALMTILLAFFICMLTLGKDKVAQYERQGLGLIKDSFGLKGGLGLLPYWKAIMRMFPDAGKIDPEEEGDLLGYKKGSFESEQLDAEGILKAELQNWGYSVRIVTPIVFDSGADGLGIKDRRFLDRIGSIFYNENSYILTVCSYDASGDDVDENRTIAARRADMVAAYLRDRCGISADRVGSVGYTDNRYIGALEELTLGQGTVIFIRKTANG